MKRKVFKLAITGLAFACMVGFLVSANTESEKGEYISSGIGNPEVFLDAYHQWEAEYIKNGGDKNLVIGLDWSKGLSETFTQATGEARFNLIDGLVSVRIAGLPEREEFDFWMIDDKPGEGKTVMPEPGDLMIKVGTLKRNGNVWGLDANLGSSAFAEFDVDTIVVTGKDKTPTEDRLLLGYTTAFYALYRSGQRGHFGLIEEMVDGKRTPQKSFMARFLEKISPTASAQESVDGGAGAEAVDLVSLGRRLFFVETFSGNGRTCGSCHRENNNLTIEPAFIATLPPNDPLFVAEFNPNLAVNFEKPALMRGVGLILENTDGFGNLATKFTMRGVPHTLGMNLTLNNGGAVPGFKEATGWSGDGSPGNNENITLGDGSLHVAKGGLFEFAIGAVRQHFPKRLNRVPGVDFKFPTRLQLIAMEAFQRSTGRKAELALPLSLKSPLAAAGQNIFVNGNPGSAGTCSGCHSNAGANFASGINGNVNTGVEDLQLQPGKLIDPTIPRDGGFGSAPNPSGGFGDGTFNISPVVEAADTGPFFHNNAVLTVEGSVDFYDGRLGFVLDVSETQAIAAFMRVINALENVRSAIDFETRAKSQTSQAGAAELLDLSIADLNDAKEVLAGGGLHSDVGLVLLQAIALDQQAKTISSQFLRNVRIDQAITLKKKARSMMVTE